MKFSSPTERYHYKRKITKPVNCQNVERSLAETGELAQDTIIEPKVSGFLKSVKPERDRSELANCVVNNMIGLKPAWPNNTQLRACERKKFSTPSKPVSSCANSAIGTPFALPWATATNCHSGLPSLKLMVRDPSAIS